jgi:phage major head subunit gpT-like protein
MSSSVLDFGQLSAQETLVYTSMIELGMQQAFLNAPISNYQKISVIRSAAGQLQGLPGAMGRTIAKEVLFPWSPPTAQMEQFTEDRTFLPLVRETIRLPISPWQIGYKCRRTDFFNDVQGTLRNIPQMLMRPVLKLADKLVAQVLRNGKVDLAYTGQPLFSTTQPISVSGAVSGTYSNLITSSPLTSANVGAGINAMMALKGEDNLSLNIRPDTLIVPPNLYSAAVQAVELRTNVFSTNGNAFPGQAANTASFADNWVAQSGIIKQVVMMPELTDGGASIDTTTWYLAECLNPERGGAWGILYGEDPTTEVTLMMAPDSPSVAARDEFTWGVQKWAGARGGLPILLQRHEA